MGKWGGVAGDGYPGGIRGYCAGECGLDRTFYTAMTEMEMVMATIARWHLPAGWRRRWLAAAMAIAALLALALAAKL